MTDFYKYEAEALPGWFSALDMAVLFPALSKMKKNDVYLEVGVNRGRSLDFARKCSKGRIFGIDIEDTRVKEIPNTTFIHASSNDAVEEWSLPIDVLFIDGDHSYEGCMDDWRNFSPYIKSGGWVFFHDCDETSPGVVQVFDEIGRGWHNKGKSPDQRCSMAWVQKK
jgi:predicted O-methyltransferase YrrM